MALLWIEGCEGFGTSIASAPAPSGIIGRKYPVVGAESAMFVQAGRTGGYSINLVNPNCFFQTVALTTDNTLIVGCGIYKSHMGALSQAIITLYDGTTAGMNIRILTDGTLEIRRGTTQLEVTSNAISLATWYYLEFKVVCHDTTGSYDVHINETEWASDTNVNTKAGSNNYHDKVMFKGNDYASHFYVDDIYVCDSTGSNNNAILGNVKVLAIRPDQAGDDTDWTPSAGANYAAVDEEVLDEDSTYVETSSSGDQDLYNFENVTAVGAIKGIQIITEMRVTDAQSYDLNSVIKSGATEDEGLPETVSSLTYVTHVRVAEEDPNTSDLWQAANINSCQFGIKAT
jgi:hypothetical protein